jgi:hypothetical protein
MFQVYVNAVTAVPERVTGMPVSDSPAPEYNTTNRSVILSHRLNRSYMQIWRRNPILYDANRERARASCRGMALAVARRG